MAEDTRPVVAAGEASRGIPTTYMGTRFRSRLEARWAAFFDLVGWRWEYEPLDLKGYIPDFLLILPHAPMLVEVKPAISTGEMQEHTAKIEQSGWAHEAIVVGAFLGVRGQWGDALGLLAERRDSATGGDGVEWWWDDALLHWCPKCVGLSFHHSAQSYHCRISGCYDGDHYVLPVPEYSVERMWRHTGNATQWRAAS